MLLRSTWLLWILLLITSLKEHIKKTTQIPKKQDCWDHFLLLLLNIIANRTDIPTCGGICMHKMVTDLGLIFFFSNRGVGGGGCDSPVLWPLALIVMQSRKKDKFKCLTLVELINEKTSVLLSLLKTYASQIFLLFFCIF